LKENNNYLLKYAAQLFPSLEGALYEN